MSRKRPRRQPSASVKVIDQKPNNGLSLSTRITMDELMNEYARLGGQENLLGNDRYRPMRLTQNFNLLNTLYRGSWIIGRIVDVVAEDMTKNWYKLKCQIEPEFEARLTRLERKAHVKEKILEGMKWGRLYGGAAGIIVLEGQEDMLDQPLDLNMVSPGSFKGILIADRWSGVYPSSELVTDIGDPDEGLPMYYIFSMDEANLDYGVKVHHSRVIRFTGKKMPYIERVIELHWGMSEVERVFEELNKRDATSSNIAQLIFQAHLRVLKMEHLGQDLAFMDADASGDLYRTLQAQNKLMNNMSLQVLSKDDDFQTFQYTFSGLSDVYELFMMDLAGAAEIPVTRLFGRSPAGLNATGESDLTNYYDKIRKDQNAFLSPILDKLLPVMCLSAWGAIPDDLDYDYNPVRDVSEEKRAELIKQSADAINQAFQSGLISQKIALKELRESGASLNMWTNITDEDIENADDTMGQPDQEPQMEGMEGMPEGMPEGPQEPQEEQPEAKLPNKLQRKPPLQPGQNPGPEKPKGTEPKKDESSGGLLKRLTIVLRNMLKPEKKGTDELEAMKRG